jgi:hypothetical protein
MMRGRGQAGGSGQGHLGVLTVPTDLKRLGKRGSYRLGRLRSQGISDLAPPVPFRPRFARDYRHGPVLAWTAVALAGVAVIAAGAAAGLWFVPLVAGLAAGLANRVAGWRARIALPAVAVMALAGWGTVLGWRVLHGQSYAGAAQEIAVLGGLPGHADHGMAVTLLVAVLQALVGYWLGRALRPRPTGP